MPDSFRTRVPYRHTWFTGRGDGGPTLSVRFRSRVAVRPARLALEGHPRPHTRDVAQWIHDHDVRRAEDKHRAPHVPFVYQGYVADRPEDEQDVRVRLWEVPSGRPLEAELPRAWFRDVPHKGMPVRLVTWMVEDDHGELVPRGQIERLGAEVEG
jgi:hypothetical protein